MGNLKLSAGLMAVGVGSAMAAVEAAERGAKTLTVAAALFAGGCTVLSVTAVIAGWTGCRPAEEN